MGIAASVSLVAGLSLSRSSLAQGLPQEGHEPTNIVVVVKEYDTGGPVAQAHITLQFWEPRGATIPRKGKKIVYNAKTDSQGRCKFQGINKGKIVLMITASGHQSYGQELELEKDNQVFEIKLKKPQPLV